MDENFDELMRTIQPGAQVQCGLPIQVLEVNEKKRTVRFVASDETVDRYHAVIAVDGWNLANYRRNPVFLFGHRYDSPLNVIGRTVMIDKNVKDKKLVNEALFAEQEINPLAEMTYRMYTHKPPFLNAVSVGFIVQKAVPVDDEETEGLSKEAKAARPRIRFVKQELLEISGVVIPANPSALVDQFRALGVDPVKLMAASAVLPGIGDPDEITRYALQTTAWARENGLYVPGEESRAVVPYKSHGTAPENTPWDGGAEVKACGDDLAKLKSISTWFDAENPDAKGSYKLPHHQASGLKAVWNGVRAAMGACMGARGGVSIPAADKAGCVSHLRGHYKEFDKEPPTSLAQWEEQEKAYSGREHIEVNSAKPTDKDAVPVTGIWLRTMSYGKGDEKRTYVEVLAEVGKTWKLCIKEQVADAGGEISHIVEPLGIEKAPDDPVTKDDVEQCGASIFASLPVAGLDEVAEAIIETVVKGIEERIIGQLGEVKQAVSDGTEQVLASIEEVRQAVAKDDDQDDDEPDEDEPDEDGPEQEAVNQFAELVAAFPSKPDPGTEFRKLIAASESLVDSGEVGAK